MRKAGVWLGLIEDEDDAADFERGYRDEEYSDRHRDERHRHDPRARVNRYSDEFVDDEVDDVAAVSRTRIAERLALRRAEREERDTAASVRSITREPEVTYPVRDNLALAPEIHVAQRPAPAAEADRRYQITTLHPTTYREARTIGEHFREGTPVIMNLTEMEEADARRLVDFGAGLAFGLRGTMERVTNRVFLLSPANVQVTAEDKAKIAEGGFFHQS
jgi:cell division inhibitor SepF